MPNWVYNNISIGGPSDELARFMDLIGQKPYFADDNQSDFSFHTFITPIGITVEEYNGRDGTNGIWYEWNNANWNTKWDASDISVGASVSDDGVVQQVDLHFNTAWSPPSPVFLKMSEEFPTLNFHVHWEEEQGFGEEYTLKNASMNNFNSWDIPDSHTDYVERGDEEGCVCAWNDDKDEWYNDCPGKQVSVYTVEVVTKYVIQALNEEQALASAEAEESGYSLPDGVKVRSVEFADDYRVVHVAIEEASE